MAYNFIDILIAFSLAIIMFGIGLSLSFRSFRKVFKNPRSVVTGLVGQMILLPLVAILLGSISTWSAEFKVGLLILAVCPGGTTSNFITYLLKGDTALSISLTTLNSLIALISIPYLVNFGLFYFMGESTKLHLPYLATIANIFLVIVVPAFLGVFINSMFPGASSRLQSSFKFHIPLLKSYDLNIVKLLTIILLGLVFAIKFFADKKSGGVGLTTADFITLLPLALVFNLIGLLLGLALAQMAKLRGTLPMTLGIEIGLQNTALALLIAGTLLQNVEMQKPALIYALFSFWTVLIFGLVVKKYSKI